ncbi:MAG TPA: 50S ribosomal protein L25 [bacterium]|nr:50S ribosomal protein L25 [bacterium]
MEQIQLKVEKREVFGKGASRKIRRDGNVPTILYGEKRDPVSLSANTKEIEKILSHSGTHPILDLQIPDVSEKTLAMIKDVQTTPLTGKLVHLDLIRISLDKKVEMSVELHVVNSEEIKKQGGIIQLLITELQVECFPDKMPDFIALDLSTAQLGDSFTIADLKVGEGIEILDDPEEVIATVLAPKAEAETTTTEAAETEGTEEGAEKADKADKKPEKADKK